MGGSVQRGPAWGETGSQQGEQYSEVTVSGVEKKGSQHSRCLWGGGEGGRPEQPAQQPFKPAEKT